ncbi:hypothetical protein ZWY2020_001046 [Hordeum vulgare]|nr:hypothetical protein ZWY2020_001046 [Hordeum vulgare]
MSYEKSTLARAATLVIFPLESPAVNAGRRRRQVFFLPGGGRALFSLPSSLPRRLHLPLSHLAGHLRTTPAALSLRRRRHPLLPPAPPLSVRHGGSGSLGSKSCRRSTDLPASACRTLKGQRLSSPPPPPAGARYSQARLRPESWDLSSPVAR